MGEEINLMAAYPRAKRDVQGRGETKTEQDRALARRFDREFFDGDRRNGYGGFNYHPRFWQPVVPAFQQRYGLTKDSSLLDVGCAKGFMLHDFAQLIPGIQLAGVDVSQYAIDNAIDDMRTHVQVANAIELPFPDEWFDLVVSVTTIHNLERDQCAQALCEIMRVSRGHAFITVDAYRDEEEKARMHAWNLTAKTILHVDEWKALFARVGYRGDYYWFIP